MWKKCLILAIFLPVAIFAQLTPQQQMDAVRKESEPVKQYDLLMAIVETRNPIFNSLYLEIIEKSYPYNLKRLSYQGLEENSIGENMVIADRIQVLMLQEKDELLIESQISLIGKIGSAKHEPSLFPYLIHANVNIRLAAIRALFQVGTKASVPYARDRLAAETGDSVYSKDVRKFCMLILSKYQEQDSLPVLEEAFKRSLQNGQNQDESFYAMSAIKSSSEGKAQELVVQNTNKVNDADLKGQLVKEANLPAIAPEPLPSESPSLQDQTTEPETQPPAEQPVPVEKPSLDFKTEMKSANLGFDTPEEGLVRAERMLQLIAYLEAELTSGSLSPKEYSKLGDACFRLARIYDRLLDPQNAKEYYKKADESYARAVQEWRKK